MNPKYREPLVLKDHPTQHFPITNGVHLALFGISLIIAGALIDLNALRLFSPAKDTLDWIAGYFGGIVFVAGAISVVFGMRREARRARYLRQLALWPGHPWFYDFPWNPEGISFSSFGAVVSKLMAALIWSVPIPCFCYWVGSDTEGVVWMGLIMSLLISLASWIPFATTLSNFFCFGDSYLSYESFPFFLGKQLAVRLRSPKLVRMDTLSFILRCIRGSP